MESIIFDLDGREELMDEVISHFNENFYDLWKGSCISEEFSDGEVSIHFNNSVRGKRVYLLTCPNSSNKIIKLLLAIDAAKRASAKEIIPIITYFPYSRGDKKDYLRGPISAKVISNCIEKNGATQVITLELHSDQIQGFFNIPVTHIDGKYIFDECIYEIYKKTKINRKSNLILCAPDAGATKRLKQYRDEIKKQWNVNIPLVMIDKTRKVANEVDSMTIIGDVDGKDVIIIDDMVDTAGTLSTAIKLLKKNGAKSVRAIVTHPILSGDAINKLIKLNQNNLLSEFICSNTIPLGINGNDLNFIKIISIKNQICNVILANGLNYSLYS